jgi:hypothetical protein
MFVRGLRISPMILVGPGCSFRWDPADAGVGSGWYPPEPIGGGRYGRWTGPDPVSTFDVALVGSTDYRIEFEVFHVVSAELLESVSLKANGVAVDLSRNFGVETQVNVFSGVIPCSVVGPSGGVVALELGLERTMRPCEVDETNLDPRRLGMLLGGFTIVSCNSSDSSPESTRMESRNPTETMVEAP